jgi:hypothetical protein
MGYTIGVVGCKLDIIIVFGRLFIYENIAQLPKLFGENKFFRN